MNAKKVLKKGFTLIEVVIVLAIAALIMVVVFLAVTGAQRAQRDQARKDYANAGLAKISEFRGNNGGTSAALVAQDYINYMGTTRAINGQVPVAANVTVGDTPDNTPCVFTAAAPLIRVQGSDDAALEQSAICLEANVYYVAHNQ